VTKPQFFFVGPDDSDTCDGCEDAVNDNPYDADDVPEPGEFECMTRCRHMIQVHGDAPEGTQEYSWSGSLGFRVGGAAKAVVEDGLSNALDDGTITSEDVARYLAENGLTEEDLGSVLDSDDLANIHAAVLSLTPNSAPPTVDPVAVFTDALLAGDVLGMVDALDDVEVLDAAMARAAAGFSDGDAQQAYDLAEALEYATQGGWQAVLAQDGRWYVTTTPAAYASNAAPFREVGTASSGDHGHTGRPGHRGGSLPSGLRPANLTRAALESQVEKTFKSASDEERAYGLHWYENAHAFAQTLSDHYHITVAQAAAVIASLSPQVLWERNQMMAIKFLMNPAEATFKSDGKYQSLVGQNQGNEDKARAALVPGTDLDKLMTGVEPNARKQLNFFHNLLDPTDNKWVTMDRHAINLAIGKPLDDNDAKRVLNAVKYNGFAQAYRDAAAKLNLSPNTVQAITWANWRDNYSPGNAKSEKLQATFTRQRDELMKAEGLGTLVESETDDINEPPIEIPGLPDVLQPYTYDADYDKLTAPYRHLREGGEGSGNFGHDGRPGSVGGSAPNAPGGKWRDDAYTKDGKVDLVPISFAQSIPGNKLGKSDIVKLKQWIIEHGIDEPGILAFDKNTGEIKLGEGNHRAEALRQLGYTHMPIRAMRGVVANMTAHVDERGYKVPGIHIAANQHGYTPADQRPTDVVDIPGAVRVEKVKEGGVGSGNFGHDGRPGEVGGSVSIGKTLDFDGMLYHSTADKDFKVDDAKGDGFFGHGLYLVAHKSTAYGDHVHAFQVKAKLLSFDSDSELEKAVNQFYKPGTNFEKAFVTAMQAKGYEGLRVERGLPPNIVAGIYVLWTPSKTATELKESLTEGGSGSGNFGHGGRPGAIGGSASSDVSTRASRLILKRGGVNDQY
jgi:hypothetical protein